MTTLIDRSETALLVIDVQVAVVERVHDRDAVVGNVATLVERARAASVDVVWVQHRSDEVPAGGEGWQIVPELERGEGEPVVHKSCGDSFEGTDLEAVLAERGVGRLAVVGAQTDQCIRSTLHGAIARGYDATLVSDAHTTEDLSSYGAPSPQGVIAHTNLCWSFHTAPGRAAAVVETAGVGLAGPPRA